MARVRITVSFDLPDGATREEALAYVEDAVSTWKGCYHPDDPMRDLDYRTVCASLVTVRRGKRVRLECRGGE